MLDLPKPPAPPELVSWLEEAKVRKADPNARVGRGDLAGRAFWKGQRNMMLFKLGAYLRRGGGTPESIEAFLQIHNRQWCKPPLHDDEVRQIAKSVMSYAYAPEWALDPFGYAGRVARAYGLRASHQTVLAALYNGASDRGLVTRGHRRLSDETGLNKGTIGQSGTGCSLSG